MENNQVPENEQTVQHSAEQEALFKTGGSVLMLVLCIVTTVQLVMSLASNLPSSILSNILPILVTIGLWLIYLSCRNGETKTTGIQLVRIPFIISFVVMIVLYILVVIVMLLALAGVMGSDAEGVIVASLAIVLVFCIAVLVFLFIYFRSINGCLKAGLAIMNGEHIESKISGKFAAVIMIISAVVSFLPGFVIGIISVSGVSLIGDMLAYIGMAEFTSLIEDLLAGYGVMSIISSLATLAYQLIAAVLIFQFVGNVKKA